MDFPYNLNTKVQQCIFTSFVVKLCKFNNVSGGVENYLILNIFPKWQI